MIPELPPVCDKFGSVRAMLDLAKFECEPNLLGENRPGLVIRSASTLTTFSSRDL